MNTPKILLVSTALAFSLYAATAHAGAIDLSSAAAQVRCGKTFVTFPGQVVSEFVKDPEWTSWTFRKAFIRAAWKVPGYNALVQYAEAASEDGSHYQVPAALYWKLAECLD